MLGILVVNHGDAAIPEYSSTFTQILLEFLTLDMHEYVERPDEIGCLVTNML
jgi:hypothetical protein